MYEIEDTAFRRGGCAGGFLSVSTELEVQPAKPAVPPALVALIAPDAGMPRQAKVGGVRLALLVAMACALFSATGAAVRVEARAATLEAAELTGQLTSMSDRQIEDDTHNAERVFLVKRLAWGLTSAPIWLLLTALSTVLLGWFLKGRIVGKAVFPVAAATLLPGAVADLLDGVDALRHLSVPPLVFTERVPRTITQIAAALGHPLVGSLAKVGGAFDLFSLWSALMLGYGVAAAANLPVRRALTGTMVAWLCWRLLTHVATGG